MKAKVDRELCMGVGSCVAVAPEIFKLDEEFKAVVLNQSADRDKLIEAAESCPYQAIIVEEDDGKQVFP